MAFGRSTPVGAAGPRRGWRTMRRRRGAASTIASNKAVGGPQTKLTDMRAASARLMSVVGAVIDRGNVLRGGGRKEVKLGFYTTSHPIHPLCRAAPKERAVNVKAAATEKERQKVPRAVDAQEGDGARGTCCSPSNRSVN